MNDLFLFGACITCFFLIGAVAYLADENQKRRREIRSLTDVFTRSHRILTSLVNERLTVTVFKDEE